MHEYRAIVDDVLRQLVVVSLDAGKRFADMIGNLRECRQVPAQPRGDHRFRRGCERVPVGEHVLQ